MWRNTETQCVKARADVLSKAPGTTSMVNAATMLQVCFAIVLIGAADPLDTSADYVALRSLMFFYQELAC